MFQEALTSADPDTVDKAIRFGAIGLNMAGMLITVSVILAVYALKSKNTPVATKTWLKENAGRFAIGGFLITMLAIGLVIIPDLNALFQVIGFNADKSPVAIGICVGLLLIGATSEPSKSPEG